MCAAVTWDSLRFAHQVTCGPEAPVAWRHTILFTALAIYAAFALPTVILIWRGRTAGLIVAILLASSRS